MAAFTLREKFILYLSCYLAMASSTRGVEDGFVVSPHDFSGLQIFETIPYFAQNYGVDLNSYRIEPGQTAPSKASINGVFAVPEWEGRAFRAGFGGKSGCAVHVYEDRGVKKLIHVLKQEMSRLLQGATDYVYHGEIHHFTDVCDSIERWVYEGITEPTPLRANNPRARTQQSPAFG